MVYCSTIGQLMVYCSTIGHFMVYCSTIGQFMVYCSTIGQFIYRGEITVHEHLNEMALWSKKNNIFFEHSTQFWYSLVHNFNLVHNLKPWQWVILNHLVYDLNMNSFVSPFSALYNVFVLKCYKSNHTISVKVCTVRVKLKESTTNMSLSLWAFLGATGCFSSPQNTRPKIWCVQRRRKEIAHKKSASQ